MTQDATAPRVVVLDHTAAMGGAEMSLLRLVTELRGRSYPVQVVLFADGPLADRLRAATVPLRILPLPASIATTTRHEVAAPGLARLLEAPRLAAFVVRLAWLLRSMRVDLVQTNSLKSDFIGVAASALAGKRCIWYMRDRICEDYLPERTARAVRWSARHLPRHVITNSQATMDTLRPLRDGRWTVACPGLPADRFVGLPPVTGRRQPVIGIVGRISPTKGQDLFLRAAAEVSRDHPSARFVVIGGALFAETDYEAAVRELPAELGIADRVSFTGFVDDPMRQAAGFAAVVHASPVPEPFGQVVIEAMAAGIPVIATRSGGVPEIFADAGGEIGWLVEPRDVAGLAVAMRGVLDRPAEAARRAARAREHVAARFTVARTADTVLAAWRAALRPHGHRCRKRRQ